MSGQACTPCAKRKVRCDRQLPCQNCTRRKQDTCAYPEISPADRIKRLEALVRSLGGDPDDEPESGSQRTVRAKQTPQAQAGEAQGYRGFVEDARHVGDVSAVLVDDDDGKKVYLETSTWSGWQGWDGYTNLPSHHLRRIEKARQSTTSTSSNVLRSIFHGNAAIDLIARHPSPAQAGVLWHAYDMSIDPVLGLTFDWEIAPLKKAALQPANLRSLSMAQHSFVFAVYLVSVVSLSKEACVKDLGHEKTTLLSEFQASFEEALARSNFLSTTDVTMLQAVVLYATSGYDRLCTASLWSLMGVAVRTAQRLGLHRDGTFLKLPPAETERRRRIWWQLQSVDINLSVRTGHTSLTLMGNWDTRFPLNIEDEDLKPGMLEFPSERKGLTKMSQSSWVLGMVQRQRINVQRGVGPGWATDRTASESAKLAFISEIEDELNHKFLQHCDPLKPSHLMIQLSVRATMCGLRRMVYHPVPDSGLSKEEAEEHHEKLVEACLRCLEYDAAFYEQPSLRRFDWFSLLYFPWGALICVLLEVNRQHDSPQARRIWDIVENDYAHNYFLSDFGHDPRRLQAAELTLHTWKTRASHIASSGRNQPPMPAFVSVLQTRISEHQEKLAHISELQKKRRHSDTNGSGTMGPAQKKEPVWTPTEGLPFNLQLDDLFDLDFGNVDWSFWNNMDVPFSDIGGWQPDFVA